MKHLILLVLIAGISFSQNYKKESSGEFYMGFGTSVSTFLGGEFGKAYSIRLNYTPDYYDNYGNFSYYEREKYDNSQIMYSPIQLDANLGYFISNKTAIELESSFIWHLRGRPDPDFVTGTEGDMDYIDKNDNSTLFAVPLLINLKFYPIGRIKSPFYIKAGVGFQFVKESTERVREFYTYDEYYYNYYSSSYTLARYEKTAVLPGFKIGAGLSYSVFNELNAFTEIEYSYFKNTSVKGNTPLALDKARYTGLLALNTKIYFSF